MKKPAQTMIPRHVNYKANERISLTYLRPYCPYKLQPLYFHLRLALSNLKSCLEVQDLCRAQYDDRYKFHIAFGSSVALHFNQHFISQQERVGSLTGGIRFLELCGFERTNGGQFLYLPREKVDLQILNSAMFALNSAITNPYFGLLSVEQA